MSVVDLGEDLLSEVLKHLEPDDIASCARVSRLWNVAANSSVLWSFLCRRLLGSDDEVDQIKSAFVDLKTMYRELSTPCSRLHRVLFN